MLQIWGQLWVEGKLETGTLKSIGPHIELAGCTLSAPKMRDNVREFVRVLGGHLTWQATVSSPLNLCKISQNHFLYDSRSYSHAMQNKVDTGRISSGYAKQGLEAAISLLQVVDQIQNGAATLAGGG